MIKKMKTKYGNKMYVIRELFKLIMLHERAGFHLLLLIHVFLVGSTRPGSLIELLNELK